MRLKRNNKFKLLITVLTVLSVHLISCEKKSGSDYNPPSDHTVSMGGYLHKDGYTRPLTNCFTCHGETLTGGTSGVSCYECHDKKW
ncbi:MAG: hypothetical protein K9J25_13065 [Bacteroidales bacterium]|nr:hypothetical protein [Bacteroidales bacterium]